MAIQLGSWGLFIGCEVVPMVLLLLNNLKQRLEVSSTKPLREREINA